MEQKLLLGHETADMIMPSSSSRENKAINLDQSPNPNQITDLNQVLKAFPDGKSVAFAKLLHWLSYYPIYKLYII